MSSAAKCDVSGCGKIVIGSGSKCHKHLEKVEKKESVEYSVAYLNAKGTFGSATTVNIGSQAAKLIEKLRSNGPLGMGPVVTDLNMNIHHETIPHANISVWFTWNGVTLQVYGIGAHVGDNNKKYRIDWFDGSTKNVTLK